MNIIRYTCYLVIKKYRNHMQTTVLLCVETLKNELIPDFSNLLDQGSYFAVKAIPGRKKNIHIMWLSRIFKG